MICMCVYIYIYIYIYPSSRSVQGVTNGWPEYEQQFVLVQRGFKLCLHTLRARKTPWFKHQSHSFTQSGGLVGECHVFVVHYNGHVREAARGVSLLSFVGRDNCPDASDVLDSGLDVIGLSDIVHVVSYIVSGF